MPLFPSPVWRLSAVCLLAGSVSASVIGQSSGPVPRSDSVFGLERLHQIVVTIPASEWNVLQTSNARGGGTDGGTDYVQADGRLVHIGSGFRGFFPWVHAGLRLDGKEFKDVGLRYKGNSSFSSSSANAPLRANFKVKLDLFDTKADWNSVETLNLHAGVIDTSLMREALSFAVFRAAGVPAPRTAYAELTFNVPGIYEHAPGGRFVVIENVNKQFLKQALPSGTGLLMKPEGLRGGIGSLGDSWASYVPTFRPDREATIHEQQRVVEFSRLVSQTDVALFREEIASYLDVDEFLRYLAVNAFLENWDSYLGGSHNFYLYLDPKDDKFRFIPWDEDLAMGARFGRGGGTMFDMNRPMRGDQALIYWLLDDPAVNDRYHVIVKELAATAFSRAALMKTIDSLETVVGVAQGGPLRSYVDGRVTAVEQAIAGWKAPNPGP